MRLATYFDGTAERIGALKDDGLVDLGAVATDMLALIDGGPALLAHAAAVVAAATPASLRPLDSVELRAPIPRPRKNIVCLGMNYAAHAYESLRARGLPEKLPEHPVFFTKAVTAVNRPGGTIPYDSEFSQQIDWEGELAFIIGRGGKKIRREAAMGHIFGYTIMNDISARNVQSRHQQFFLGKSMDGSAPLGPWIVTADEIADPHNLQLRTRVNGEIMQDSRSDDLIFNIPEIIAVYSLGTTLEPGDIFATGTPSGVAMGMAAPRWLRPGDVVEVEIEGIGVLRNTIGG